MIRYKFFLDIIDGQEIWLNSLAEKGYRLVAANGVKYTFEECDPSNYIYMVDAVSIPAEAVITEHEARLDSHRLKIIRNKMPLMGDTTFLICEKKHDESPLEISTTPANAILCYKKIRTFILIFDIVLFILTILSLVTDLFIETPMIKVVLAFTVFYLTVSGFNTTRIIGDYITRMKLSEPL